MKQQAIQYLALDVHQATTVATVRKENGAIGVISRVKAIFRGRAIGTAGEGVYRPSQRAAWLGKLEGGGVQSRAASLLTQRDVLLELRNKARAAMIDEARRQPGWKVLRSVPFFGPVRVAILLAVIGTPFRFRGKRQLWPY